MKFIRLMPLLLFIVNTTPAFSQKYHFSGPPLDGYIYVDTSQAQTVNVHSNRCANIISENKTVFASGKGVVISCTPTSAKTYEIAIDYGTSVVRYVNITNKKVFKSQEVDPHAEIGDLPLNPKDKQYHLGLQVLKADNPNEILWGRKLAQYLNAYEVSNALLSQNQ